MTATTTTDQPARLAAIAEAMADLAHPTKVAATEWARAELTADDLVTADRESTFAWANWKRLAERGVHGLMVAPELGGGGADLATTLLTLEGLGAGHADNGLLFALASQMLSSQIAIERFGSPEQQAEWLTPLLRGEVLAGFALTEPEAGSDAFGIEATAVEQADGSYVLNAHKAYITFGSRCAVCVVFARTNPEVGRWGISAFVVPMDLPGVVRGPNREKMGMRTTPFGDLEFHDVVVPASAMLGRPGAGASIFGSILEIERAFVLAPAIGAMERWLATGVGYANERHQAGVPIGVHQAVSHRLVDMKRRHETSRLMLYRAALAQVTGRDVTMYAALAKIVAGDDGIGAAFDAVKLYGAKGYVTEYEVERDLRDAVGGIVYSGTSDIQRNIVARLLGLPDRT
ncbi:MAG: acyl-CoA dehydrogenase family protein [Actinomycetota bacterium]